MKTINNWGDAIYASFENIISNVSEVIPNLVGAILIMLFGWLFTKFLIFLLKKILNVVKINSLSEKLNESNLFEGTKINFNLTKVIIGFVKFAMLLIFLIVAFDVLKWESVSQEIANLLRYLPKLFSAIALFLVGIYVARFIKNAIEGLFGTLDINGSKVIASIIFYLIAILVTITSLNQAGIDTTVITNNLSIILGAFLLSFALAFGFGSRNVIERLLFSFYSKQNFEIGEIVEFEGIRGEILSINSISVSIKTTEEIIVVPIKELADKTVAKKINNNL